MTSDATSAADGGEPTEAQDTDFTVTERRSIGRNFGDMLSSQLATWVIATALAFIVPRFLGPADLGELRLAGSLWLIAGTITGLGTSQFLQLAIARSAAYGLAHVGSVLVLRTAAFVGCAALLAVYVGMTSSSAAFAMVVALIGLSTLFGTWSETFGSSFIGLEQMSTTAFNAAATKLLNFVAVVTVLVAGGGLVGVAAVGVGTAAAGLSYLAWRYRRHGPLRVRVPASELRDVARQSAPFMAAGVALVLYQQIDLVVISWVAESEDLGWYGAADTLFGSLLFPATVLMAVVFPTLGRLHATDDAELERVVTQAFRLLSLAAVPIGLGTLAVAPQFAPLLYGEDFRETGVVLAILGPVIVLTFGTILFGSIALATGRARLWVSVMLAAAALTVPLDLALVPWAERRWDNGAIGGALAYVVTEGLQFVAGISLVTPFLVRRETMWRLARILAGGGLMLAAVWPLRSAFILLPIGIGAIVYPTAIWALRVLAPDEQAMVRRILDRRR